MRNNKQLREALIALCFSVWNSSNGKSSSFQLLNELSGNFISLLFITNASQSGSGCCFFPRCTQSGTVVMQILGGAAAAKKKAWWGQIGNFLAFFTRLFIDAVFNGCCREQSWLMCRSPRDREIPGMCLWPIWRNTNSMHMKLVRMLFTARLRLRLTFEKKIS